MKYVLKKNNVERITEDEKLKETLEAQGFTLIKEIDGKDDEKVDDPLDKMSVEELKAYAEEKGIDIGASTSQSGILKKIKAAIAE